jgi:teichuronic acid biosynthesis glycosyltransferase TuaG
VIIGITSAPLVSVITPVFNSERFITDTLRSVQAQTFREWEALVLIDDGTKDSTAAIVSRFAALDPRIKLIRVPNGRSVSEARNHGFQQATGRFIAFLDADDLWLPRKLEIQVKALAASPAALSYTGFRRLQLDGQSVGREIAVPAQIAYADLLKDNQIACMTAMVDRMKSGPLHMGTDLHEDFTLWLKILKACGPALGIQQDLARYRVVPGSRSSRKLLMANWRWRVYREQEGLSLAKSVYYYVWYALYAAGKHLRF